MHSAHFIYSYIVSLLTDTWTEMYGYKVLAVKDELSPKAQRLLLDCLSVHLCQTLKPQGYHLRCNSIGSHSRVVTLHVKGFP